MNALKTLIGFLLILFNVEAKEEAYKELESLGFDLRKEGEMKDKFIRVYSLLVIIAASAHFLGICDSGFLNIIHGVLFVASIIATIIT